MSARPMRIVDKSAPPLRSIPQPPPVGRLVLSPIQWGTRDLELGKFACRAIVEATPAIVVRFNPFTQRRVRSFLTALRIHH